MVFFAFTLFFYLARLPLLVESQRHSWGLERVKGGEPPTQPGPGGVRGDSPIVLLAQSPWGQTYLWEEGHLWEAVPTLFFSLSDFQLILVIVGIVAGLLILGMMIALILVRYGMTVSLSQGTAPPAPHSGFQTRTHSLSLARERK